MIDSSVTICSTTVRHLNTMMRCVLNQHVNSNTTTTVLNNDYDSWNEDKNER